MEMKNNRNIWSVLLTAVLALAFTACTNGVIGELTNRTDPLPAESDSIAIITPAPDEHREELDAILRRSTMLEGVKINGVSVGGMTMGDAKTAVRAALDEASKAYAIQLSFGEETATFSGETIPMTDDLDAVLEEAFNLVREDKGFDAVSREVESIRTAGKEFTVSAHFEETALKGAVEAFAAEHDVAPQNASVAYNQEENKIDFAADVAGKAVDCDALLDALLSAENGDTVEVPVVETPAEVTLEQVQSQYVLRGTMTTNFSKSIKNRKYNICKGAKLISGTILHPGDTFSANGTLGVRNKANGWKVATAYVAGSHEKQYGGGVCQLSSTLYNAAVMADMKIVDRRNHSMPVDYVSKGLDATINSVGNIIDFKFQNSSKSDIIIIARVDNEDYTKAGKLTMEIWGIPVVEDSNGKYDEIRIPDPKKLKTLKPSGDVEYRIDDSKPAGYKELLVRNQNGSVWQSYVEYYLNGELVERKELAQSTYKAFSAVYIVGPDAATAAPADPTPAPSNPGDSDPTPAPADPTPEPATPEPATPEPATPAPADPEPDPGDGDGN